MKERARNIYWNARFYDLWMYHSHDFAFYRRLAAESSGRVLELGCGTGRLTIPIAQMGVEVMGLDCEQEMLDSAREKAAKVGVSIEFVQGDAREFEFGKNSG